MCPCLLLHTSQICLKTIILSSIIEQVKKYIHKNAIEKKTIAFLGNKGARQGSCLMPKAEIFLVYIIFCLCFCIVYLKF